ncbi:MAG: L-2-amino-thiazoline-4-carboxylic acid hydrolase [Candidatus Hodarchaeales archaeon]|jgi:hypothetical protein
MANINLKSNKVEDLSQYGKSLNGAPQDTVKKLEKIIISKIRQKTGLLGFLPFLFRVSREKRGLKKNNPESYKRIKESAFDEKTLEEFIMVVAMYNVIARKEGQEKAYEYVKSIFETVATFSMPAMYQVGELLQLEGDIFENFTKFNSAMFEQSSREKLFHVQSITNEKDKHIVIVDKCLNVEFANALGAPECGKLGCDHDLVGYPLIADEMNIEFRRPYTIAKGDNICKFMFYKKGTAPKTEEINGKEVLWYEKLNK